MTQLIVKNRIVEEDPIKMLEDIQRECLTGKLNFFKVSGTGIQVQCPVHSNGQERRGSCYLNISNDDVPYLYYHCFTCNSKGDFVEFVSKCFNQSRKFTEDWLISKYGKGYVSDQEINLEKIEFKPIEQEHFMDESELNKFESYHPYMTKRKLTDKVINKFQIKYDPETKCIVFPVRDKNGRLKFLTRRSVEGKSFIIDKSASKKDIYLLNEIYKHNIKNVVVVESQINALTCWSHNIPSIALFGAGTTKEQIEELNNSDILHFILCYDTDPAGDKGRNKFKKLISRSKFVDDIYCPYGKDINDLSDKEFDELFKGVKRYEEY